MRKLSNLILGGIIQNIPPCLVSRVKYLLYMIFGSKTLSFRGERYNALLNKALQTFLTNEERADQTLINKLKADIEVCAAKLEARPDEYFLMGFRNIPDEERKEFLVDNLKDKTLLYVTGRKRFMELKDKYTFYKKAGQYFRRNVLLFDSSTKEDAWVVFAMQTKYIFCKKITGAMGRGIETFQVRTQEDASKVYRKLKESNSRWLVEEKIEQSLEMAKWNESSVNTLRIPSFLTKSGHHVIGAFMRTGKKGSIVDNAGSGGIFACVDSQTGRVYTDGIDEDGLYYQNHPGSGMCYKGWQIPRWEEVLKLSAEIHKNCFPHHIYIGFDFALTENGWIVVEGNWGQFISQYNDKKGIKKDFLRYISEGSIA